ncbi:type I secretion system ABC transporter, HlyB family [Synechococcus sp. PCC 7502]|uniref:peptidase domain-containing ABC transporter n=1 Tax=Synechococcus sp. PCC 7502 TaxID=1173263 RepID=UPI00029FD5D1|nr:peptidase domain-containing ABC transporter [Synechococcus sp. PCC 7502]AFY73835.1 type I secretion system ABC transporter, HlyB family [Synechococcus sp. PCC 7502]
MTAKTVSIQDFLHSIPELQTIDRVTLKELGERLQPLRYRMGQVILRRETMPAQILFLMEGQARVLGQIPKSPSPVTLDILKSGASVGWLSLIRNVPCEMVIASVESTCLALEASDFWRFCDRDPVFKSAFTDKPSMIEVFDLLTAEMERRAQSPANPAQLARESLPEAVVMTLEAGKIPLAKLDRDFVWLVSGGNNFPAPIGSRIESLNGNDFLEVPQNGFVRLIGIPDAFAVKVEVVEEIPTLTADDIPYAPELPAVGDRPDPKGTDYPHFYGRGSVDASLACLQMLARYWQVPFARHVVKRALDSQFARSPKLSLQVCGAIAELMGLNGQLVTIPTRSITQVPTPAMLAWQDTFAVLYKASDRELVLGIPEQGIVTKKMAQFADIWGDSGQVLLIQPTKDTPKQKFGLSWFLPSLKRYKNTLITVLVASFFVQLLGLANPLITQVIIDKVIIQNAPTTLNTLGILLITISVFEALISALRTYLFVNTTNRIDLTLGSETIDHLVRLPLRYFEKRSVGELSSRIGELENIRQFLTGTALTVVLDAVFSVIYIIVMICYSWLLTLVALGTVPLFALLTFIVAPIIRGQLRSKAERNAATQSYLVEVVSGIQTVKAQSIELKSRWEWQRRYARYVSDGFKTVVTSTTAGSTSQFLNQLSNLLLLWVGAYLVLSNKLSLGQLIAFRIIAGYTTTPLLRLIQLWQNFQETALSLERLSDIINYPQEQEEAGRRNIPMPAIAGTVRYENVNFRFAANGSLQLNNVSLEVAAGKFVGVVGASGAGKSTLTKLLSRLYEPESGRILIDDYDISKVELYSLRRQIGVVLQDTLLFDGTVQENIALTNPDATPAEIIDAARIACAHDFIMQLPQGYESRVGERGAALSGGQRQRIAIARTVLQKPQLLILDEATSALDYNTERQVCSNLAEEFQGRTVFFITHRLATIQNADLILVMDSGRVAEQGTHSELMVLKERYYTLYHQQEAAGES